MRTHATLLLMTVPLALAGRGEPTAVELELSRQRAAQAAGALDQTVYAPSPYQRPEDLPPVLEVERPYQAFNDWYYFALVDGKVWYKPRIKRPTGEPEVAVDLPWKPFGLRGGLPYRLDAKEPSALDTSYTDGTRGEFIREKHFLTESPEQARARLDPAAWAQASTWPHEEPLQFSADFTQPDRLIAITADDDELAVLSEDRQLFYRRKFANLFVPDEWMEGWGSSKSQKVFFPHHLTGHRGWSLGRITAAAAGYKEGPDGRIFEWGPAAVSMETMAWLSPDGRTIYYLDSGTPPQVEHYIEPPFRGQYRGEAVNASASTVMLIDRFGAVVTKIADFDLLGSTPTHPYCYLDDCDGEPFYQPDDIRSGMSPIRLPPEDWRIHAPIVPVEPWDDDTWLSTRVSMLQTGRGNAHRELRVVGMQQGVLGSWIKGITQDTWTFRAAPPGDRGFWDIQPSERLDPERVNRYTDPAQLRALHADEPVVDRPLVGQVELDEQTLLGLRVLDYNAQASPWHIELVVDGVALPMDLHLVQAWSRYLKPAVGPGHEHDAIVTYEGTLGFDRQDLERRLGPLGATPEVEVVHELLDRVRNHKFALIVNSTTRGVEIQAKSDRRIGHFHAVALDLDPFEGRTEPMNTWSEQFWRVLDGHMAWEDRVVALSAQRPQGCSAEAVGWAASTLLLHEEVQAITEELHTLHRTARKFSRIIFATSGLLYVSQLKTLDVALDRSRRDRSDEVRPNELRFNVILGVTTRIPYLARNIADVAERREHAAKAELRRTDTRLQELLRQAHQLSRSCAP